MFRGTILRRAACGGMLEVTWLVFLLTMPLSAARAAKGGALVAVFEVEDRTGGFDRAARQQLTDYLASRIAEGGAFKVVPGSQIKERLREQKKESLKACYDEKCQIEIGRELAAQKSLSTQIVKLGTRCAVLLTFFDLKMAATERSASAKAACSVDDLVGALDKAVAKIKEQSRPAGPRAVAATGGLFVKSQPSGAEVWLDGKKMQGTTPLTITQVAAGPHFLELRRGDYRLSRRVKVPADRFTNLSLALKKIRGQLEVLSTPPEADVYLDGRRIGRTPTILSNIEAGQHQLKIRKRGYLVAQRPVRITGQRQSVQVTLPKAAVIAVRSQPLGAEIVLDGKRAGQTPAEIFVAPGKHHVLVRHRGRASAREVEATVDRTAMVLADLRGATDQDAPGAPLAKSLQQGQQALQSNPKPGERADDRGGTPTWGYVALGVGVASLVTAGILYGVGTSQGNDAHEKYEATRDPAEMAKHWTDVEAAETKLVGGHVLLGVGIVATGVWVYSLLTRSRRAEEIADSRSWSIGCSARRVVLGGRF